MTELPGPSMEMPRYQAHKKVWALKIAVVVLPEDAKDPPLPVGAGALIVPADKRYAPFPVVQEYIDKHKPQAGGYYVVYDDGYQSWSPAKAFEEGYTKL